MKKDVTMSHRMYFVLMALLALGCGDDSSSPDAGADVVADVVPDSTEEDTSVEDGSADVSLDVSVDAPVDTVDTPFAAFPEARGFGAVAEGGRGGRVIQVTNLNDSGPGSFREACEAEGPRTVVFRVGGTITLESNVEVREPSLTIAGQTAPGEGIQLRGNGARSLSMLRIFTHDVIVRHLRFRRGPSTNGGECVGDTIALLGADRVIIDHVSASWTTDQLMTIWPATNFTVQDSVLSEALHESTHSDDCTPDGPLEGHGLGPIVGIGSDNISFVGNVFANNVGRNPRIAPNAGANVEVVNNVIYNVCYASTIAGDGDETVRANVLGNYIKWGPNSCGGHRNNFLMGGSTRAYLRDNLTPSRNEGDDEWLATSEFLDRTPARDEFRADEPFDMPTTPALSAQEAYEAVPTRAGAQLVCNEDGAFEVFRDSVDQRSIDDLRSGTDREGTSGRRLNHPDEVGGWPEVADGTPYVDEDNDGMPDEWEARHGLDSSDADDRNGDNDEDGYTNLEEFLNGTQPG